MKILKTIQCKYYRIEYRDDGYKYYINKETGKVFHCEPSIRGES